VKPIFMWSKSLSENRKKHVEIARWRKGTKENRGSAASSGWRQNVLKYVCVKLGYPVAV